MLLLRSSPSTINKSFFSVHGEQKWSRRPSTPVASSSSSTSGRRKRDIWVPKPRHRHVSSSASVPLNSLRTDHLVNMNEVLNAIEQVSTEDELFEFLASLKRGATNSRPSLRLMVSILSKQTDWQKTLAIHDWMMEKGDYPPSIFAYNVVLRNVLRAKQWDLAHGLVTEMRGNSVSPDKFTYSTLITSFGKHGFFDESLAFLQQMEQDRIVGDLIIYSNLIELARKLKDYSKAISLFTKLRNANISPDLIAYNSMINVFGKAKLFNQAREIIRQMREEGGAVAPDTVSYSTLLNAFVEDENFLEALSVFSDMKDVGVPLDLTTCNIMIDVYGKLEMVKEADRLFWSMRKMNVSPNVVTYNTMLRVYGEAELFGEAIHLFRLMQRKEIEQNVVTYNTMVMIYGKTLEHEKATNLIQEMRDRGIEPDAITYSTIISIWDKAGKLDRAAVLFQKLRSTGVKIDQVLYQTMIVAYERAGLIGHAKRLLHELKHPNEVSRETAVLILARAGRIEEATWLFRQAFDAGEVKDISVFDCMIDLFSRNKKHANVIEVFEKMRGAGYFPCSNTIAVVLNAYRKLQEFGKAEAVYQEMKEEGCMFSNQVHFQMLTIYGASRNFSVLESLIEELESNPNIHKKDLYLVAAGVYERANRLNDASRLIGQISKRNR
ncbi:unnamed protein product [Victoria cruziana]